MFGGGVFLLLQPNSTYLINSEYSIFYTGLLILEVFFIIISSFLLCILEYLMFAKKAFHLNHTIIIALFSLVYIPASAVRIWFISKILTGQDLVDYVPIQCSVRTVYANVLACAMPTALLERVFASIYLTDYEKKKRPFVLVICLLVAVVIFIALSWALLDDKNNLLYFSVEVLFITNGSVICYVFLWRYNLKWLNKCNHSVVCCRLSVRYQIAENLRIFKLLRYGFSVISTIASVLCCLAMIVVFSSNQLLVTAVQALIEFTMSLAILPVHFSIILTVEEWKLFFMRIFIRKARRTFPRDQVTKEKEGELYFNQLKNSWL